MSLIDGDKKARFPIVRVPVAEMESQKKELVSLNSLLTSLREEMIETRSELWSLNHDIDEKYELSPDMKDHFDMLIKRSYKAAGEAMEKARKLEHLLKTILVKERYILTRMGSFFLQHPEIARKSGFEVDGIPLFLKRGRKREKL